MTDKRQAQVDSGFDEEFSPARVREFCSLFADNEDIQEYVDRLHEEDGSIDMKRGEMYPEILRCIKGLQIAAGEAYEIDPLQCLPNFGSNGSIDTILTAMKLREVERGTPANRGGMLVATPTYFRNYKSSDAKRVHREEVKLILPGWRFPLGEFLKKMAARRPTVVFLVTPNNPTGVALSDQEIRAVLSAAPDDTLVVIDRTLVNIGPEVATADLLHEFAHKQLAILHSMSKYAGMSHLRTGFALYSNLETADEIRPHLPLGLGIEGALKATLRLLDHGPLTPSPGILENVRRTKEVLAGFCERNRGYACSDFVGNYCVMTTPSGSPSAALAGDLARRGIFVGSDLPGMSDTLRIHTGGPPAYAERLVEALETLAR